jgi:hypothetical protein
LVLGGTPLRASAQDSPPSSGDDVSVQIAKLQAELQRLQAEIEALKQKQEALATRATQTQAATPATQAAQTPEVPAAEKKPSNPEWLDRFSFAGTAYFRYSRELPHGRQDFNEFEFDRIYFITYMRLTDRLRLRYTMEGARRDAAGDFDVATKHFYLEASKFPFESSRVLVGLADLPWVAYEEGIWGYRFQGTVFPDREGYLTSTDLGLGWKVDLPKKSGDFHLSVVNGEGWIKPEGGRYKDAHLRFTLSPFRSGRAKNIFVGAFGSLGNYDGLAASDPRERRRAILQGGYRGKYLRFMGSYLWALDPASQLKFRHPSLAARAGELAHARGLSLFTVFNLGWISEKAEQWELIARHDRLDPDRDIPDNEHQRWIFGASYRWNRFVQTLFDYEQVIVDRGSLRPYERRLMLQNDFRF